MKQFTLPSRQQQSGVALAIGIILLAIASVIAVMSMRTTTMQERMASNQKNKTVSLMAAESGATQVMQRLTNAGIKTLDEILGDFPITTAAAFKLTDDSGGAWYLQTFNGQRYEDVVINGFPHKRIEVVGISRETDNILGESIIRIDIEETASGGGGGNSNGDGICMMGGAISVQGGLDIDGDCHANGDWFVKGNCLIGGGTLTTASTAKDCPTTGNPKNKQSIQKVAAKTIPRAETIVPSLNGNWQTCNPANFSSGQTYYCLGNVTISNPLNGVTVIAQGNINLNANVYGSIIFAQGNVNVGGPVKEVGRSGQRSKIGAMGNIQITGGGNTPIHGDLIANGTINKDGGGSGGNADKSTIWGSVISGGSTNWNGQLHIRNLRRESDGGSGGGSGGGGATTYTRTVVEWREISK